MEDKLKRHHENRSLFHLERPRINRLFTEAVRHPLVVVCAGTGYGKTSAVADFAQEYKTATIWIQLSERDNAGGRFWENYTYSLAQINVPFAKAAGKLGFPDTRDKKNKYMSLVHDLAEIKRRVIVFDDFHFIENPSIIHFIEECVSHNMPGTSIVIISRSTPSINIASLVSKDRIFNISENDLRFTENELAQYFQKLNIPLQADCLHGIMQDTEGWVFAINLIARSYQKAPGYEGYLRNAMKTSIFRLMETEIWDGVSVRLQNFLVRLSLIGHLSFELIDLLAENDDSLIAELEKQSAYVRRDSYINAYLIHHLLLEFLSERQELLSAEEKRKTYLIAGDWCSKNYFKIDALSYYEKAGSYSSIVSIFFALPAQIPADIAQYAIKIFERAPSEVFDTVEFLAIMHLRCYMCLGLWQKSLELAEYYEAKFIKLPKNSLFRKRTLGGLYYCWGFLRLLVSLTDDNFDFDLYFEKYYNCLLGPTDPSKYANRCPGAWICGVGTPKKGAIEKFIGALTRASNFISLCFNNIETGESELAKGELKFYQGDLREAEKFIALAFSLAAKHKQFEFAHRALLYTLRISFAQGDFENAEMALKETKNQLDENEYTHRYINYDISLAWYYYALDLPENVPAWLKENFSSYDHAAFTENFGNQLKARFCYMTRNFSPLLAYIQEMKQRESFLFGRIEMLAMEACVHYKLKDKKKAFAALLEAYKAAEPNDIVMPFIELGKDMRTLTSAAAKEGGAAVAAAPNIAGTEINPHLNLRHTASAIPKAWLEKINRKAATYAKRQAHVVTEYKQVKHITDNIALSTRETEILLDLSHGLSRAEIAENHNLSINTVKMVINMIYSKAGAKNLADLIRIAVEKKLI
ncbi:MAG: LuxR C-terminal-related transcriptional regulator [Spirochaetes bacterium]|nr:LuxR C-terminal-related transcriptional regulator [Spirochaetota bacterium]